MPVKNLQVDVRTSLRKTITEMGWRGTLEGDTAVNTACCCISYLRVQPVKHANDEKLMVTYAYTTLSMISGIHAAIVLIGMEKELEYNLARYQEGKQIKTETHRLCRVCWIGQTEVELGEGWTNIKIRKCKNCRVCQHCRAKNASKRCSLCKSVHYCSRTCQSNDWAKHKTQCC